MKIYLVGGAVRDKLLGITSQDSDWVVVGGTPEELLMKGFTRVGADFPVFIHPQTKDEYALARTERKTGLKHTDFESVYDPSVTLEDDLKRRDLTINAIALDSNGKIIDPYHGVRDLNNRILRHVSDSFGEDPLRILRVARFMARYSHLGFVVSQETIELMKTIGNQLSHITPERVWKELSRALCERTPSAFFNTLRECDCLRHVLPEVNALFGVPQPALHHPEIDTGVHTMMVIDHAARSSGDIDIVYAALTHDLGKAVTEPSLWPQHFNHEALGVSVVKELSNRLKVPSKTKNLAALVCEYHTLAHKAFELRPKKIISLFEKLDAFRNPSNLVDFLKVCESDSKGRLNKEDIEYKQSDYILGAYQISSKISGKEFAEKGFSGIKIKELVHAKRVHSISEYCKKKSDDKEMSP